MSNNVEINIIVNDSASKTLRQTSNQVAQAHKRIEDGARRTSKTQEVALNTLQQQHRRIYGAYERLGVRSEHRIQREIQQTQAAYNRLARSGELSGRTLARVADQTRRRLGGLRAELTQVERQTSKLGAAWGKMSGVVKGAVSVGAGVWAAHAVVKPQLDREEEMSLGRLKVANIMSDGGTLTDRLRYIEEVKVATRKSMEYGGTELDNIAAAGELAAAGRLSNEQIFKSLAPIAKVHTATAQEASMTDLAKLSTSLLGFGISVERLEDAFGKAVAAGDAGSFELKDMAGALPSHLSAAKSLGMTGERDLARILALNQVSRTVVGTSGEAATVTERFLGSLNSSMLKRQLEKAGVKNVDNEYQQGLAKGFSVMETNLLLMQRIVEADPRFKQLQKAARGAKDDTERMGIIEQQRKLLAGSVAGHVFTDVNSLKGFIGLMNNQEYYNETLRKIDAANKSAIEPAYNAAALQNFHTNQQYKNKQGALQEDAIRPLADTLSDVKKKLLEYANEYPSLSVAVVGATTALTALAAAAAAAGAASLLTRGTGLFGRAAAGAAAGTTSLLTKGTELFGKAAGGAGAASGWLSRLGGVAGLLSLVANFSTDEEDEEVLHGAERWKKLNDQYPPALIAAARKQFQPWYQFGTGFAAENERWVNQYLAQQKGAAPAGATMLPDVLARRWSMDSAVSPLGALESVDLSPLSLGSNTINDASSKMIEAANTMQDAARQPLDATITVHWGDPGMGLLFNYVMDKQTQNSRRN